MKYTEKLTTKFYHYLIHQLDLKVSTKGFYRGNCPYCEGHYTFGVNFENGRGNCFKCDIKPTLVDLTKFLNNFETFREVIDFINLGEDYEVISFKKPKKENTIIKAMALPDGYLRIDQGDSTYGKVARNYLVNKRGFSLKKLIEKNIGYAETGKYSGYIIIPYFVMGSLVYFTTRKFIGNGPKFNNPPEEEYGIGKSQLIYNQDSLFMYNHVYTLESATNAITLGDNTIALGGKSISSYQKYLILKSPVQKITIILDRDAWDKAYTLGLSLANQKEVRVWVPPDDRDVNQLGRKITKRLIKGCKFKDYQMLYREFQLCKETLPYM